MCDAMCRYCEDIVRILTIMGEGCPCYPRRFCILENMMEAMAGGRVTSAGHVRCFGAEDSMASCESIQCKGHLYLALNTRINIPSQYLRLTLLDTILRTNRLLDPLQRITHSVITA